MWGLAGTIPHGVRLAVAGPREIGLIKFLRELQESLASVWISGGHQDLQLWFRGPRHLGDFRNRESCMDQP